MYCRPVDRVALHLVRSKVLWFTAAGQSRSAQRGRVWLMAWLDGSPMARLAFYLWEKPSFANWSTDRRLQLHSRRGEEHVIHQNDRALPISLSLIPFPSVCPSRSLISHLVWSPSSLLIGRKSNSSALRSAIGRTVDRTERLCEIHPLVTNTIESYYGEDVDSSSVPSRMEERR